MPGFPKLLRFQEHHDRILKKLLSRLFKNLVSSILSLHAELEMTVGQSCTNISSLVTKNPGLVAIKVTTFLCGDHQ